MASSYRVAVLAGFAILVSSDHTSGQSIYFPPDDGTWEQVSPADVGWDAEGLSAALDVAGSRNSSGVLILHDGRIMAERYWPLGEPSRADSQGRAIEDVASAQKSVAAVLVGIAQERGLLLLDDPVSKHMGSGWSKASAQQEQAITIRHLLSMNSGLATDMSFEAEPGTKWLYNTPAYHYVMRVLEAVTGQDRNRITGDWLTNEVGMRNSSWTPRPLAAMGFSTTARDLARFGLMIQAGGRWGDQVIVGDTEYLSDMLSPSQSLNPAYGYLWWLNGQEFLLAANARARRRNGPLISSAPSDLVAMQGARDRKLYNVPSLGLIVTRLGAAGAADGVSFNDAFWQALMEAKR